MTSRRDPAERFARMDDNTLFARRAAVLDRMARDDGKTGNYIQWTREDPNAGNLIRTGMVVSNKVGRAIGRLKDDARIIEELDLELSERGYSVEEVRAEYDQHCAEVERAAIAEQSEGDASFEVDGDEVTVRPVVRQTTSAMVPPAAIRASQRRDRLAWVPVMQQLADRYLRQGR